MPRTTAIFKEKKRILHQKGCFPCEKQVFTPQIYGINLEKVNSFILEQIRISEFCLLSDYYRANNRHINNDILPRAVLVPVAYRKQFS